MSNNIPIKDGRVMLKLDELEDWKCPYCQNIDFIHVYGVKVVSALMSPSGQKAGAVYLKGIMCVHCRAGFTEGELAADIQREKVPFLVKE